MDMHKQMARLPLSLYICIKSLNNFEPFQEYISKMETGGGFDSEYFANNYVITEFEPCFDAADFMRAGRDVFVQQSNVGASFVLS